MAAPGPRLVPEHDDRRRRVATLRAAERLVRPQAEHRRRVDLRVRLLQAGQEVVARDPVHLQAMRGRPLTGTLLLAHRPRTLVNARSRKRRKTRGGARGRLCGLCEACKRCGRNFLFPVVCAEGSPCYTHAVPVSPDHREGPITM